jgi:hypothetical protein
VVVAGYRFHPHCSEGKDMRRRLFCFAVMGGLLFACASCAKHDSAQPITSPETQADNFTTAQFSEEKVIALANAEAVKQGSDLAKFEPPKVEYGAGWRWTVLYDGKDKLPGNHFLVWVNDRTGECQLMHGE